MGCTVIISHSCYLTMSGFNRGVGVSGYNAFNSGPCHAEEHKRGHSLHRIASLFLRQSQATVRSRLASSFGNHAFLYPVSFLPYPWTCVRLACAVCGYSEACVPRRAAGCTSGVGVSLRGVLRELGQEHPPFIYYSPQLTATGNLWSGS